MKGHKPFGSGVLVAVALLLVAIPASASAKTSLQFTEAGKPAPTGAKATVQLLVDNCLAENSGTLGENPATKVVVKTPTPTFSGCLEEEWVGSGSVEEMTWESSGKLKIKAHITIEQPGPCVYEFTKFNNDGFAPPGSTYSQGETTGKLNKTASSRTKGLCAKKLTSEFLTAAKDEAEEFFGDELVT